MNSEVDIIDKILDKGFAVTMAIILIYILWRVIHYGIREFKSLSESHSADITKIVKNHEENHKSSVEKFDETIRYVVEKCDKKCTGS